MKGKRRSQFIIYGSLITTIGLLGFVDGSFQLFSPTAKEGVVIVTWLAVVGCLCGLVMTKGTKQAVFLFVPYVLAFIAMEIGTRIWIIHFTNRAERASYVDQFESPANLGLETVYVPHHYTLYNLRPNFSTDEGTFHNSLGLRDHRVFKTHEKVIRIVFIGGSTTYTISIKKNSQINIIYTFSKNVDNFIR